MHSLSHRATAQFNGGLHGHLVAIDSAGNFALVDGRMIVRILGHARYGDDRVGRQRRASVGRQFRAACPPDDLVRDIGEKLQKVVTGGQSSVDRQHVPDVRGPLDDGNDLPRLQRDAFEKRLLQIAARRGAGH